MFHIFEITLVLHNMYLKIALVTKFIMVNVIQSVILSKLVSIYSVFKEAFTPDSNYLLLLIIQ